jgi:hypothetical protein
MYSEPPNTGPSGIRMVIFRTLFKSGYRMALAAILLKPFKNWTKRPVFEWSAILLPFENRTGPFFTTSLDGFIIKYFLFMTIY